MNNKYCIVFSFLMLCGFLFHAGAQSQVKTTSTEVSVEQGRLTGIQNLMNDSKWSVKEDSVFLIHANLPKTDYSTKLVLRKNEQQQAQLTLTIQNTSQEVLEVSPVFPNIKELHYPQGKADDLFYLYPKMGWAQHNADTEQENVYSRWFPLQFIDVYDATKGGIYVMTQDTTNYPKKYYFSKKKGKVDIRVTHQTKALQPGETWELPPVVIAAHAGDWHDGFFAYKDWVKTWYKPLSPRKAWFQDVYNLRQVFMHNIFGGKGVWDPATKKVDLVDRIEKEKKIYGGIDYVHIFDWTNEPQDRIFNYEPWEYLGGKDALKNQISLLQKQGMNVGFYYQGYKIHKKSDLGIAKGEAWRQMDINGKEYDENKSRYYYPCAYVKPWQDELSNLTSKTTTDFNTNGVYIDVYGFGYQFGCYDPTHGHPIVKGPVTTNYQTIGEVDMLKAIRSKLSDSIILYVEEMPTDVSTQYLDATYTYAVNKSKFAPEFNPSSVNLFRFLFTDFKLFELLQVDSPVGMDTIGIKSIFFNGEGIWINGPTNDYNWHPEPMRKLIRKTHAILSHNKEPFRSNEAIPLVSTLNSKVYANYFPSTRKNIWTLYNAGDKEHKGDILIVDHVPGARYYDAWNDKKLNVKVVGQKAHIAVNIHSEDAGCVIQSLDPVSIIIPKDPVPEVYPKKVAVTMKTAKLRGEDMSLTLSALSSGNVFVDWGDGQLRNYEVSKSVNRPTTINHVLTADSAQVLVYTENKNIMFLNCNDNKLISLDVSQSPMLQYLRAYNNMLTELDITSNYDLILLHCYSNKLTQLDLTNNYKINDLQVGKNKISDLNVQNVLALARFMANENPLGSIDLSNNKVLTTLNLRNCGLTSLDVSKCVFLTRIDIFNAGIKYANQFSACALNNLYASLPAMKESDKAILNLVYTHNNLKGVDVEGSQTSIAEGKNWTVKSNTGVVLKGNGKACSK